MKHLVLSTLIIILTIPLYSSKKPQVAPMNPQFLDYLENKKSGKHLKSTIDSKGMGFIPSPMYYQLENPSKNKSRLKSAQALPATYDLRDENLVTSVKDQGALGSCWTFGVVGALESNWLVNGYGEFDLSEENMATCHGFEWQKNDGGNYDIATAYLSTFQGPLSEFDDPYSESPISLCKTLGKDVSPVKYVTEARYLAKDEQNIKRAIMEHGGVAVGLHIDFAYQDYFNSQDNTFYYGGRDAQDHGVMLVGWDDNMTVTGGPKSPEENPQGAWIAKNSWGTSFGDNGYFYISYQDTRVALRPTYFPKVRNKNEIKNIYFHDELGAISSIGYGNTSYGLVKYTADSEEFIEKIGTYIVSAGSVIDIEIYEDYDGTTLSNLLGSRSEINCPNAGYYTFDMPAIVDGDFYVLIKYFSPYFEYPVPIEAEVELYAYPEIAEDVAWISEDKEDWDTLGANTDDFKYDVCIRAYSRNIETPYPSFTIANENVCLNESNVFSNKSLGEISSYSWDFGEGASPQTADTEGPHEVTYSSSGKKTISLTVTGPGGSNTFTRQNAFEVSEQLNVFTPYPNLYIGEKDTIELVAFGAENYEWSPSTGLSASSGQMVDAFPTDTTVYTVTGTQGACSGTDEITVHILPSPANDDICDAMEVKLGKNGVYTNRYATVEQNEPWPPMNGCFTQNGWCDEYQGRRKNPLDNSIWFYFYGPEGGKASFRTDSIDTQMAIYKATSCQEIFNGNYELVAANDDYIETEPYWAGIDLVNLTPGTRYWIQIDGSGGGTEGYFNLYISEEQFSNIHEYNLAKSEMYHVYPNPSTGRFNITFNGEKSREASIKLYNINGEEKILHPRVTLYKGSTIDLHLNNYTPGIYILKIISGDEIFTEKIIKK